MHYALTYHISGADYRAPNFKLTELHVDAFADRSRAEGAVAAWESRVLAEGESGSYLGRVVSSSADLDFGGPFMVRLYNTLAGTNESPDHMGAVNRFATKGDAQRRIFKLIQEKAGSPADEKDDGTASAGAPQASVTQPPAGDVEEGDEDMAAKKKAKTKTKKPASERKTRGVGKAPGKVADFRPVRDGTDRAKVLRLMNGKNTASQIAAETGIDEKKIGTIVFCLSRDSGIGYEFGPKGELKASFPGSHTLKDAIKAKAE